MFLRNHINKYVINKMNDLSLVRVYACFEITHIRSKYEIHAESSDYTTSACAFHRRAKHSRTNELRSFVLFSPHVFRLRMERITDADVSRMENSTSYQWSRDWLHFHILRNHTTVAETELKRMTHTRDRGYGCDYGSHLLSSRVLKTGIHHGKRPISKHF